MKRVVFAAVLMAAVVVLNIFCFLVVTKTKDDVTFRLNELSAMVDEKGATEEVAKEAKEITEYWLDTHHTLCRIVRHKLLEQVTIAVSRLEPLARYGETGELSAEISHCRLLVEEIWDSERPILRNIF